MAHEEVDGDVSAKDVASYVRDVAEQLASLARTMGLESVAQPLEQAHRAATRVVQENAAPDDAA